MNLSVITFTVGYILRIEGVIMLLPCGIDLIYGEHQWMWYLISAAICFVLGLALSLRRPKNNFFYLKEGCVTTALCWIALSLFGALPLCLSGEIPSFLNSVFEMASGFTTTGASIVADVGTLSHAANFWRTFSHWIGGMGVLVFLMAIIPMTGGSAINLMKAESPGPDVGKLVPHIRETARILYKIYIGLTVIEVIILLVSGMPVYDSFTMSFATAGTGGFAVRTAGMGDYTIFQQVVLTVFMILFGVNFNAYYYILYRKFKKAFKMEEVRAYLLIIIGAITIIAINIFSMCEGAWDAIQKASFQVGSIITTTGFSNTDFDTWPELSKMILISLMFVGACAGSTGGGFKISRVVILVKTVGREIMSYIHPKNIKKINFDGNPIDHETMRSISGYFVIYTLIFIISLFLLSIDGPDFETDFTAVAATFNNIGPGMRAVGPTQNFDFFSPLSKIVMIIDMIAGRLELFPLLILFYPRIWMDDISHRRTKRVRGKSKK
ncbi:MAG: TrkH family potassium uptake protein [Eubacterium sp.]|nr:TrkH family potassium uptake protein [Eubacterium sp.]